MAHSHSLQHLQRHFEQQEWIHVGSVGFLSQHLEHWHYFFADFRGYLWIFSVQTEYLRPTSSLMAKVVDFPLPWACAGFWVSLKLRHEIR